VRSDTPTVKILGKSGMGFQPMNLDLDHRQDADATIMDA
jgi:hypothetical protein